MKLSDVANYVKYHGASSMSSLLKEEPAGLGLSRNQARVALASLWGQGKVRPVTTKWSLGVWWVWICPAYVGINNPMKLRFMAYEKYEKYWGGEKPRKPNKPQDLLALHVRQFSILRLVEEYTMLYGGITLDQLCEVLDKRRQSVMGQMHRLKQRGFVTTTPGPGTGKRGRPPTLWVLKDYSYPEWVHVWSDKQRKTVMAKLEVDRMQWAAMQVQRVNEQGRGTRKP